MQSHFGFPAGITGLTARELTDTEDVNRGHKQSSVINGAHVHMEQHDPSHANTLTCREREERKTQSQKDVKKVFSHFTQSVKAWGGRGPERLLQTDTLHHVLIALCTVRPWDYTARFPQAYVDLAQWQCFISRAAPSALFVHISCIPVRLKHWRTPFWHP